MVKTVRIIGIVILLSALATGTLALFLYFRTAAFLDRAEETTATVIGYEKSTSHEGSTMYSPIVAYEDNRGQKRETTSTVSSGSRPYAVGDEVSVLYDPEQPSKAEINAFWSLWLGVVITGAMTGFAMLLALFFIIIVPIIIRAVFKDIHRVRQGEPIS